MIKVMNFIFIFFQIIPLDLADIIPIPLFKTNKESILKILSLENTTLDVPALFVFGDSFVDAGNNIYFTKWEHRNYFPYGIDFDGKPTGRYTNGRTVADFIAQIVGLPFPPPVLSLSNRKKRIPQTGINYATGFTGLLYTAATSRNSITTLTEQVELFENTTKKLQQQFESKESFSMYMSKALFFINSGSQDLDIGFDGWHYFYDDEYLTKLQIEKLSENLKRLYQLGARKIVINNIFPIGCEPAQRFDFDGECSDEANDIALLFNKKLLNLVEGLQSTLSGSKFVLINLYKFFEDVYTSPTSYGFININGTCCSKYDENYGSPCLPHTSPCKDRNIYVFFDPYNPTESMHFIWARRMLKDSSISYPINLIQLIQS